MSHLIDPQRRTYTGTGTGTGSIFSSTLHYSSIVDPNNRFILLDKFSLDLKDIAMKKQTIINNTVKNKKISIITRSSTIPHVHTIGLNNENN